MLSIRIYILKHTEDIVTMLGIQVQRRIEQKRRATVQREQNRRDEHRKKEEQRKFEMEKERVGLEKLSLNLNLTCDARDSAVTDSGWKPAEIAGSKTISGDDPMLQQINIIRGYVKQAKQAQKYDEVRMLEENLRDLQQEWWRKQNASKTYSS